MSFDLGKARISFKCQECGFTNSVTLNQVKQGQTIICSGCHKDIQLVDKDRSTNRAVEDINKSIEDLNDTIDRFNRSQR